MTRMHRSFALFGAAVIALAVGGCQKQAAKADPAVVKAAIQADEKK